MKTEALTVWYITADPATPWHLRLLALFIVAYAFSPIDLIPDFIPVLGYLDDLILLPAAIFLLVRMTPRELLEKARSRAREHMVAGLQKPRSLPGIMLTSIVWVIALILAIWLLSRFYDFTSSPASMTPSSNRPAAASLAPRAAKPPGYAALTRAEVAFRGRAAGAGGSSRRPRHAPLSPRPAAALARALRRRLAVAAPRAAEVALRDCAAGARAAAAEGQEHARLSLRASIEVALRDSRAGRWRPEATTAVNRAMPAHRSRSHTFQRHARREA